MLKYLQMKYMMPGVVFKIRWNESGHKSKKLAMSFSLLKMSDGKLGIHYTIFFTFVYI